MKLSDKKFNFCLALGILAGIMIGIAIGFVLLNNTEHSDANKTHIDNSMAKFNLIDMDTYPRREHYECFTELACSYSYTVSIDITELYKTTKQKGIKIYPALIWVLTTVTNNIPEFRMSLDDKKRLGVWENLSPTYMTMPERGEVFSSLWTEYNTDFMDFYKACVADIEQYTNGKFEPQGNIPPNVVNITTTPWLNFTSCSFYMPNYLLPILTIGKFTKEEGKVTMPLAIQVHHAVCDAYHVGQFVEQTEELLKKCNEWIA